MNTKRLDITKKQFRDDWSAYLVIADQVEEEGDHDTARLLRRQGETMKAITKAITPVCKQPVQWVGKRVKTVTLDGDLPCGASWQAWVAAKIVTLVVQGPPTRSTVTEGGVKKEVVGRRRMCCQHVSRSIIADPKRADYLPRRIREMFIPEMLNGLFERI